MANQTMQVQYDFGQKKLVDGVAGPTDLLIRFRMPSTQKARRPLNLSLVIDRSGSMAGAPLQHALRAAQGVVDALDEADTLSVVVYDDDVDVLIEPTAVKDKAALKNTIGRVRAGGLTNLSGGWLKGIELVGSKANPDSVNRVLLLTDGQANVGITNEKVLTKTAGEKAEGGVSTTTLGFGSHFQEDLLIGMARAAGGNFYFIQSTDDATEVFGIELETLKAVAAQNLTVTLKPADGVKVAEVLSVAGREGKDLTLELGDVYEDEDKLLGIVLDVPALTSGEHPLLSFTYKADAIQDDAIKSLSDEVQVKATAAPLSSEHTGVKEVVLDIARLRVAHAKESAVALADKGDNADAAQALRDVVKTLTDKGLNEYFEIAEEIEQLEHFASRIAARSLTGDARKELLDQSFQGQARGRADLLGRGVAVDEAALALPVVKEAGGGVELLCVREGGKLRIKVTSDGYDQDKNVQFPRALRAEDARYVVEGIEPSADGSFYRVTGDIKRLVREGEVDPLANVSVGGYGRRRSSGGGGALRTPKTLADLDTTDAVGDGVLIQIVKDKSKLRARVVSDGYDPNYNMRFPRSIREEGLLFVVDDVKDGPDGKSYIATGDIKKFVQPT